MTRKVFIMPLLMLISLYNTKAQITIKPELKSTFELARDSIPEIYQDWLNKAESLQEGQLTGFSIFTAYKTDTVNIEEISLPEQSSIQILNTNGRRESESAQQKAEYLNSIPQTVMKVGAFLIADTLHLKIGMPFGNEEINHRIYKDTVITTYKEYYEDGNLLKANEQDTLTSSIQLPAEVNGFQINTDQFTPGNIIIGYCDFKLPEYYVKDYNLDGQVLKLKRKFRYYFKTDIKTFN